MHSDLPLSGTKLRGYVQTNGGSGRPSYLGPVILAQKGRPVRVKFTNALPTGAGGNLFIPTDTTYMGAGLGPDGTLYTQNRATLHLHGGNTPWISDGTPHQWTVPAFESTNFKKGVSARDVPDMPPTGDGSLTFYWTNQQGGRFMFYHDHAYGITRLNVYAGEAAGYLLYDPAEENALAAATVPGTIGHDPSHLVPLVIQDKTFVPDDGGAGGQLAATDPTWSVAQYGGKGNLWFPHVYMPNQNPADITGANAYGRWDYGPWFWPPQNPSTLVGQPVTCTSAAYSAANPPAFPPLTCPGTPNPSGVAEGFMDTPLVNGTAYPKLTVEPAAYRFQILSAGNDRTLNLGLYVAEPLSVAVTVGGSGYAPPPAAPPAVTITPNSGGATANVTVSNGAVTSILVTGVGSGYSVTPLVTIDPPSCTINGSTCIQAVATAVIDPIATQVTAINVTNSGAGYTVPPNVVVQDPTLIGCSTGCQQAAAQATLTPAGTILGITVTTPPGGSWTTAPAVTIAAPPAGGTPAVAIASVNSEVKMVDAVPHTTSPSVPPCSIVTQTGGANLAMATLDGSGNPLNGTGLQAGCWPTTWPTDGRDGGVPDPATAGPAIIQIGTEGGLLPSPVAIPSTPVGYEYNRRSITVLNIFNHGLLLGPAERADVVVDFSQFAGKTLILYNDAPAPVPAFDPRNDYYTGDPDQTSTGGAPSTLPGYGPNTRTIMQINVAPGTPLNNFSLSKLRGALPNIFTTTQDTIIVPEPVYPLANGGGAANYARIQDNSINLWNGGPVGGITLKSGGSGYTSAPTVSFAGGGGSGAAATATLAPAAVASLTLGNGGSYTSAPTVSFTGGGGTGAAATAKLAPTGVASINVSNGGSGYTGAPTVTIASPAGCVSNCKTAAATAAVAGKKVKSITVTSPGSGYTFAPGVTFSGGGGSGAAATATLAPAAVASLTLGNGGSYTSAPTVSFTGGGGSGATATATLAPAAVASITLTNGGTGYTSAPTISFSGGGSGATATATAPVTPFLPKTIQELFTLDYGRMNATLGVELPFTNFLTQTTIPYGYIDPPTEIFKDGETQLWKITHNGVDTHFIHFHLFNVQVINRVGWDGAIKPPDPNELSWKDTVRMNPLEDIVVALKPMKPNLPWDLPNSIRPLDVTQPLGSTVGFTNIDPTNQPAAVTNDLTNFGWEYVWHCHILGHEENDMMRAMSLVIPPAAPTSLAAIAGNKSVRLTWVDNSLNETGFTLQRAPAATGPWSTVVTVPAAAGTGTTVTYTDTTVSKKTTYYYRVGANNVVGYTQSYAAPAVGYPYVSADSVSTNPVTVTTP